jgi:membrane associated rhomboid family serine protease
MSPNPPKSGGEDGTPGSTPDSDGIAGPGATGDRDPDAGAGPDSGPLALGLDWLQTVPATLAVCLVLVVVYAVELSVVAVAGRAATTWWFVATTTPSPGWVLGPLAHAPADPTHLVGNLLLVVVFGGMTERRLGSWAYLAVLAVAGLGGTGGQLAWYGLTGEPGGTLGASAMGLAATAFATTASLRARVATGRWTGETSWVWVLLGVSVVGRRLVLDLAVGVPAVGRFGHLWGILFGTALALSRRGNSE